MPHINGDHDFAIAHMEKAYGLNPANETISHALGLALFKKSRALSAKGMEAEALEYNGRAIAFYEEALALEPRYVEAHINLGVSLAQEDDYDAATEHFQEALRLKPSKTFVRNNIERMQELKAMTHPIEWRMREDR